MFAEGRHILFTTHSRLFDQAYSREQNTPPFRSFFQFLQGMTVYHGHITVIHTVMIVR